MLVELPLLDNGGVAGILAIVAFGPLLLEPVGVAGALDAFPFGSGMFPIRIRSCVGVKIVLGVAFGLDAAFPFFGDSVIIVAILEPTLPNMFLIVDALAVESPVLLPLVVGAVGVPLLILAASCCGVRPSAES